MAWKEPLLAARPLLSDAFDRYRLNMCLNKAAVREAGEAGPPSASSIPWAPQLPLLLARMQHGMLFRGPRLSPDLQTVSFRHRLALKAFVSPTPKQDAEPTINFRSGVVVWKEPRGNLTKLLASESANDGLFGMQAAARSSGEPQVKTD